MKGVISSMLATLVIIASIYIYRRHNNNSHVESYIQSPSISLQPSKRISKSKNFGVEHFVFDDLDVATEYFSIDNRLGDGGSAEVFYGKLYKLSAMIGKLQQQEHESTLFTVSITIFTF